LLTRKITKTEKYSTALFLTASFKAYLSTTTRDFPSPSGLSVGRDSKYFLDFLSGRINQEGRIGLVIEFLSRRASFSSGCVARWVASGGGSITPSNSGVVVAAQHTHTHTHTHTRQSLPPRMMLNGRRRRQRADVAQKYGAGDVNSSDDGSGYPRISSRTGGYESSVASHLVSSASEQASLSTGEDASTVKFDNTTTATSQELMMFRMPELLRLSAAAVPVSSAAGRPKKDKRNKKKKAITRQRGVASSKASSSQQRSRVSSSWGKDSSVDSASTLKSHSTAGGDDARAGGGRGAFLRKLVDHHQAFRVCRNDTEATVDAASDDSRSSPQRMRFVLPDHETTARLSTSMSGLKYTSAAHRKSPLDKQRQRSRSYSSAIEQQDSDGYEVLSHPTNKTMTIVHSSLTQRFDLSSRSEQQPPRHMIVDSDLVDTDGLDDSSSSSSFSHLLMTDGDLMKNQARFGTGIIRLTMDSLKEHEGKHDHKPKVKIKTQPSPPPPFRNNIFSFLRRCRGPAVDPVVKDHAPTEDETEKSSIERKRLKYLKAQRQRELESVTKAQRDSIFDSLVDNKSRATQSTASSAASHVTPRCHGCPTAATMAETFPFWNE
jgi:hypothetical protein